ncbi:phage tail fiber domain-containing protein [Burkholderia cenocepacia]|uniref:phage tail fiber domain-containing protein n=1 Tax=Burkholderia cenocepacia TaxID=95486 RepID=UPI002AB09C77|nr:phage tail fiber protein [Burkholderia cenocepacia]
MAADYLVPWLKAAGQDGLRNSMMVAQGDNVTKTYTFNFAGGYISKDHIKAYVYDEVAGTTTPLVITPAMWTGPSQLTFGAAFPTTQFLVIYRDTPKTKPLVEFKNGAIINEPNLDEMADQAVFTAAETADRFDLVNDGSTLALNNSAVALAQSNKAITDSASATSTANTALSTANAASSTANAASTAATGAVNTANTANSKSDTAISTANAAKTTADAASGTATNALNNSNVALTRSQEAKDAAAAATTTANSANTAAGNAVTTANSASSKADTAISTANTAKSTADTAKSTADGIDAKATQALGTANSASTAAGHANTKADNAVSTANGIDAKAQQALDTANGVDAKATNALNTANSANTKADQALAASDGTYNGYIKTYQNGDEAGIMMLRGSRQTPGNLLWAIVAANMGNNGDLYFNRQNDSGVYAGSPVIISRASGWVTTGNGFTSNGEAVFNARANFFGNIDNTSTSARGVTIGRDGNNVGVRWRRTEGGTDAKVWDMVVDANDNILKGRVVNDAVNAAADFMRVSRTAMAVSAIWFGTRPQWNVSAGDNRLATAWDSINFDPSAKANIANPTFQGTVTTPNLTVDNSSAYAGIVIKAGNYMPRIQTSQSEGLTGFVNGANTAYNFTVYDNGDTNTRGYATFQRGMTINDRPNIARNGWQADLQMQNLSGNQNSNVFLRARIGGGLEIINSAYNGVPWQVADNGETFQSSGAHIGPSVINTDGNVWGTFWENDYLSNWIQRRLDGKASYGAQCGHADMTERGPIDMTIGTGPNWNWLGSPWVLGGIGFAGGNRAWLRFVWLRI